MMKKWLNKNNLACLCAGAVLAAELLLLTDLMVVFCGGTLSVTIAAGLLLVLTLLCFAAARRGRKRVLTAAAAVPLVLCIAVAAGFACWKQFSAGASYQNPDSGKNKIYGDQRVMLVVPHQDDDINILGGVMEEYARYGSDLYAVFITNGDYYGLTDVRYRETIQVFESMGVPQNHVIYLGYGDNWKEGGPHLYNAESGVVIESHFGRTETYGPEGGASFREGRAYTIDNLMEDLQNVILEYSPDVIFCSDYDHHIDHKATTLLFDKVMGRLLKEHPEYKPTVYKAYAYGTAWEAEPDYYAQNILSTQNLFEEPYSQEPAVYRWEDRVRFPVDGSTLSRSLIESEGYTRLNMYKSQDANLMAAAVVNGDKVAWQRHTTSLCLHADISASSGQEALLNDFMLLENHSLVDENRMPYDGVWIPEQGDAEKAVSVKLKETAALSAVVLYDHPSEVHNVLNAQIVFDDGTKLETGPLDPNGAATVISVEKQAVTGFRVVLTELEGDQAGLSEMEAFSRMPEQEGKFLKLMDGEGNFLYDYWMEPDGNGEIRVYLHGDLPELTPENYVVNTDSDAGTAVLEDGVIRLHCPAGESFVLNVTCNAAGVSDSIYVHNPGRLERLWTGFWQDAEQMLFLRYSRADQKKLLIFSIPEKISYVIRHML